MTQALPPLIAMDPLRQRLPGKLQARFTGWLLPLLLAVVLVGCSASAAGLNAYRSPDGRYAFLYPTGWTRVQVSGGPQVVFHDLIHTDETLSLLVAPVTPATEKAAETGAQAVGERLLSTAIAPAGGDRTAALVAARERQLEGHTFFDLEYTVQLSDRERHELATVVADRGRLYTLSASTNDLRWAKVQGLFEQVIGSFNLTS